jgi:hypothetical protein
MLGVDPFLAAAELRLPAPFFQLFDGRRHVVSVTASSSAVP